MPRKRSATLALLGVSRELAAPAPPKTALVDERDCLAARLQAAERDRSLLRTLIDQLPDLLFVKDQQSRFLVANLADRDRPRTGVRRRINRQVRSRFLSRGHRRPAFRARARDHHLRAVFVRSRGAKFRRDHGREVVLDDEGAVPRRSRACWSGSSVSVMTSPRGGRPIPCGVSRPRFWNSWPGTRPLVQVFDRLAHMIEAQIRDVKGCVMLLEPDGSRLRVASAPSLPEPFRAALDGMSVRPDARCCGGGRLPPRNDRNNGSRRRSPMR